MSKVTVELDDEQVRQLQALKERTGLETTALVSEAIVVLATALDQEASQPLSADQEQAVREGLAAIDRGEVIPHEEVFEMLRRKYGE